MNERECFDSLPGLVRLQMANQVPANVSPDLTGFWNSFLHAILAEVARACINRLLHCSWIKCLGDGDEGYIFGVSTGSFGRSRDLFADSREPLSDLFGHRARILSAAVRW